MSKIGFVGLGQMGGPMSTHLIEDGHDLVVYDVDGGAVERAVERGASAADTPAGVARAAEVVFASLPRPEDVEAVALGEDGLADGFDPGDSFVDLTTSNPATTNAIADELAGRGVDTLGAPVSGGAESAVDGTLSVMAGGDPAVLEACRPLLAAFATDVFHVGERPGHGHAAKLLNNYLAATALVATAEATVLGARAGLDAGTLCDVFNASSGRSYVTEKRLPEYLDTGEARSGFAADLMRKDVGLFVAFGEEYGTPLLHGAVVSQLWGYVRSAYGSDDVSRVYDFFEGIMTGGAG